PSTAGRASAHLSRAALRRLACGREAAEVGGNCRQNPPPDRRGHGPLATAPRTTVSHRARTWCIFRAAPGQVTHSLWTAMWSRSQKCKHAKRDPRRNGPVPTRQRTPVRDRYGSAAQPDGTALPATGCCARGVHAAVPEDPEAADPLALMLLTDARRPARSGADGDLIPLAEQNRTCGVRIGGLRMIIGPGAAAAAAARGGRATRCRCGTHGDRRGLRGGHRCAFPARGWAGKARG